MNGPESYPEHCGSDVSDPGGIDLMAVYSNDKEIVELIERFETRSLPKIEWTHAAHLTVALFYCTSHPLGTARNLMRDGIFGLNDSHGTENSDTSGYHETLTCFWMDVVQNFILGRPKGEPLYRTANALVGEYPSDLPLRVYSRELLFSVAARSSYVAPDLIGTHCESTSERHQNE